MSLKIDENWRIESDNQSWSLTFEKFGEEDPKTGKRPRSFKQTHHPNIRVALEWYCDQELKPCETAMEVLAKVKELNAKIEALDEKALRAMEAKK